MNEILDLVQITLDNLLSSLSIRSYWGRRAEIDTDENSDEYIIYEWESDPVEVAADAEIFYRIANISLQYYVKYAKARTYAGRKVTSDRMDSIMNAMRAAGFGCPDGWFEIGDVDEAGCATFRAEFEIPHKVGDE